MTDDGLDEFQRTPKAWKEANRERLTAEMHRVGDGPARRIVDALTALPDHLRAGVCWSLITDESSTLAAIGEAMIPHGEEERVEDLGPRLWMQTFIGDLQLVHPRLADDVEPWATIRQALEDVDRAWHEGRPGHRTAFDRHGKAWEDQVARRRHG